MGKCECCEGKCADKDVRVSFCPRCKSRSVKYVFGFGNLFGVVPKMRCGDCGFDAVSFPVLVTSEEKLRKSVEGMKSKVESRKSKVRIGVARKKVVGKKEFFEEVICPKCKSDNVKNNMRYSGDSNMLCQDCGFENIIFPVVKKSTKKKVVKRVKKKVVKKVVRRKRK